MPDLTVRRSLAAIVACTAVCVFVARPAAAANPVPPSEPGLALMATPTPAPSPTLPSPNSPIAAFPAVTGPLASKILKEEAAVEALGQQVRALAQSVDADGVWTSQAFARWQAAVVVLSQAEAATTKAATKTYENLDALGPLGEYSDKIQQFGLVVPGLVSPPIEANGVAGSQSQAQVDETDAFNAYLSALSAQQALQTRLDAQRTEFDKRNTALSKLISDNKSAVQLANEAQNKYDSGIGASLPLSTNVKGQGASPKALTAIKFAMKQLGDPYVWGAEGPSSYDCSGLMWAAYRSAGVSIPRVARYQYHATTPISIEQLLPGDLVFFSTTSRTDWTQISHVGMYIGGGKMIEAPQTGDVVKIAPVWWSAFFGATRVVSAVAGSSKPSPSPTPTPKPTPSPSSSTSPSPSPSSSTSPSPSPSDSASPSPSPSPSQSPSPSTSPSPSPSPSDSTSPSPSPSPSPSQSPSPSSSSSTSPSPSPSDSASPSPSPSQSPSQSPSPSDLPSPSPSPSVAADSPSPSPAASSGPTPSTS